MRLTCLPRTRKQRRFYNGAPVAGSVLSPVLSSVYMSLFFYVLFFTRASLNELVSLFLVRFLVIVLCSFLGTNGPNGLFRHGSRRI